MVKATRTSAVLLGLAALGLLGSSVPAFAEVQNVKVGGDFTGRAFVRSNLDLHDNDGTDLAPSLDGHDRFFMWTTGLNVGADLTENVSAFIRLANEREAGRFDSAYSDVAVSQSYVVIRDAFYTPATLSIGRKPFKWGRGFVLGSGLLPNLINGGGDLHSSITANEWTDFTAMDGIEANLDLRGKAAVDLPLAVDFVYIKLNENVTGIADDVNLVGVNLTSKFDAANSEVETYWINKRDRSKSGADGSAVAPSFTSWNHGSVHTVGVRGSAAPVENSNVYGELAYQFGTRAVDPHNVLAPGDRQQAWAVDLGAEFTAKDVPTSPTIGGEWIFFSGKDVDGAVGGWDPIARGSFTTALREFQNPTAAAFYPVDQNCQANGSISSTGIDGTSTAYRCTGSATNQHQLSIYGNLKPLEDLTIAPRVSWFITDVGLIAAGADSNRGQKRRHYAGMEWDTQVVYNYTDDVQLGVLYALFAPGNVFRHPTDQPAQELVTTVGVKF